MAHRSEAMAREAAAEAQRRRVLVRATLLAATFGVGAACSAAWGGAEPEE